MATRNQSVQVAIIGAAGLIAAAIISAILQPSWWRSESSSTAGTSPAIAGTVVDQTTNRGIGQAVISIVGRSEMYVTEDNGNFRIELRLATQKDGVVRIHVAKEGYVPYDGTTTPTVTLIIQLRKM